MVELEKKEEATLEKNTFGDLRPNQKRSRGEEGI